MFTKGVLVIIIFKLNVCTVQCDSSSIFGSKRCRINTLIDIIAYTSDGHAFKEPKQAFFFQNISYL